MRVIDINMKTQQAKTSHVKMPSIKYFVFLTPTNKVPMYRINRKFAKK